LNLNLKGNQQDSYTISYASRLQAGGAAKDHPVRSDPTGR